MVDEQAQIQEKQLKELIRVMEVQNTLLTQMLSFMSPVHDFFKALHLVVRVGAIISGVAVIIYELWDWIVLHVKH